MSDAICSNRCGGTCCERFFVHTHTPEQIRIRYENAQAQITAGEDNRDSWDTVTIHEMLIPLELTENGAQPYGCRHFDKPNGLCMIYDHRPLMCARFPTDGACTFCGFTKPTDGVECAKEAA